MSASLPLPRLAPGTRTLRIVRGLALVLIAACSGALLVATSTAGGQLLKGSYKVIATTDLGPDVRVTLSIHLANSGDDKLFVTGARLREISHPGETPQEPASVTVEPHGVSSFTQEFTLPKKDFDLWNKSFRPSMVLNVQIGGNPATAVTIALMRRPG